MNDNTTQHSPPEVPRENTTVYQVEITREFEGDFVQDARGAIMQGQIEDDARTLILEGESLILSHEGSGRSSLVITATDLADLDNLRNMADARGYELRDHGEVEVPPIPGKNHPTGARVLMQSPTEYLFGKTYRPRVPDSVIKHHVGHEYHIVGYDLDLERDPALTFRIRFEDDHEVHVLPEEIDNTYHSVVTEAP